MSSRESAGLYAGLMMASALLTAIEGAALWQISRPSHLVVYLGIVALASWLNLGLPIARNTIPLRSFLILLSVLELNFTELLLVTGCSAAIQHFRTPGGKGRTFRSMMNAVNLVGSTGLTACLFHSPGWASSTPITIRSMLAAGCFFVVKAFSEAAVNSLANKEPFNKLWPGRAWYQSYGTAAVLVGICSGAGSYFGWQVSLPVMLGLYLAHHFRSWERLGTGKEHAEQMAALHLRTIEALALAIEAKDQTTHDHLRRVQVYAMEIGRELNLSAEELDALRAGALLHDIGKLAVPEHIISKPGKLTPEEFEKMKVHPIVGAEILERVEFPYPVVPIVAAHHEKWDGSGYPRGLEGEEIPIGARILSAVDCLDALASDRQYRRAIPLDQAMQVLVSESGKAFDPKIVEILKRRYVELEQMAKGQPAARLSRDCVVECGAAPAAGFEAHSPESHARELAPIDFLAAIAGARQEAQVLFEIAQNLGSSLNLDETLSVMAVRMEKIIPYDGLAVYLKSGDKLKPAYVTGDDRRLFSGLEIPLGEGLSGWVAENGMPIVNGNPNVEPGYLNDPSRYTALHSALAVPLEGIDGVVGVLTLYHAQKDAFHRDHLRILQAISSKLALSIENDLKYRMAKESATIDYLTGLLNAHSLFVQLEKEVSRCARTETPLTVLVCDLDGFKLVNDRFGHLEGNRILRRVADALRSICREYDCVARMGGDEFAIVLPGVPAQTVDGMIERFCAATRKIGESIAGEDILALSVGKAVLPRDGCEAEALLAEADRQMYKSKRRSKLARESSASTLSLSRLLADEQDYQLASRPDILLQLGPAVVAQMRANGRYQDIE